MTAKLTVVEAMPPSKLRGVSDVPSGFSCKLRYIRDDDDFWLKKGWEYLLPATMLPARWAKRVGSEVVWAILADESGDNASRYNFWRRKDHWFERRSLANNQKALQSRRLFTLVQSNTMQQPDENELYEAVMDYGWFNRGLEEPEIEVGFSLDTFEADGDAFKGVISQHTVSSESLEDFFDGEKDWTPYYWSFSFEGQWKKGDIGFEITAAEYIGDGSRSPLDYSSEQSRSVMRDVFLHHDFLNYLEEEQMTAADYWSKVHSQYEWLQGLVKGS